MTSRTADRTPIDALVQHLVERVGEHIHQVQAPHAPIARSQALVALPSASRGARTTSKPVLIGLALVAAAIPIVSYSVFRHSSSTSLTGSLAAPVEPLSQEKPADLRRTPSIIPPASTPPATGERLPAGVATAGTSSRSGSAPRTTKIGPENEEAKTRRLNLRELRRLSRPTRSRQHERGDTATIASYEAAIQEYEAQQDAEEVEATRRLNLYERRLVQRHRRW